MQTKLSHKIDFAWGSVRHSKFEKNEEFTEQEKKLIEKEVILHNVQYKGRIIFSVSNCHKR